MYGGGNAPSYDSSSGGDDERLVVAACVAHVPVILTFIICIFPVQIQTKMTTGGRLMMMSVSPMAQ